MWKILQIIFIYCLSEFTFSFIQDIRIVDSKRSTDLLENNFEKILHRKRRYVAFPEGSSISASLCTTIGAIGNPNVDFLSYALNWGVAYDLPNETWVIQTLNGFKINNSTDDDNNDGLSQEMNKAEIQRRHRRNLFSNMEVAMDSMGFNGRDCILRALCESSKYFSRKNGNMIEKLLGAIFSFPKLRVHLREHRDIQFYDKAYRKGIKRKINDCQLFYSDCKFSLLELALG